MIARTLVVIALVFAVVPDAAYLNEIRAWRTKHETDYRREYVPLAGLFFLTVGLNTAGSAASNTIVLPKRTPASIGRFVLDGPRVRFEPMAGVKVLLNRRRLDGPVDLVDDETANGPDEVSVDDVALWVHLSGDRKTIRMRDPKGDVARGFAGFRWFPIDEGYRVSARFIKDPAPRDFHTPNLMGDDTVYQTEGIVEFTLNGQTVRLRPATTRPGRLYFVFRDGTSGKETYETARFLYADLKADGTTVLDFNQAYNPPCAFNPFTTCPLPLPENRLTVRILAGEKAYGAH
jgi:uncharacterized protein (DUF1684 family)